MGSRKWDMGIVKKGTYIPVQVADNPYGNEVPG